MIIKCSSDANTMHAERIFLNKLNLILVQVSSCSMKFVLLYELMKMSSDIETRVAEGLAVLHS